MNDLDRDATVPKKKARPTTRTRGRGLEHFKRRFKWSLVKWILRRARERHGKPRVLEVGCGEGRLLLDLMKRYPDLELHGVNKEPWKGFADERGIRRIARRYGILSKVDLATISDERLPRIRFADAAELPFPDNSFDLVVSQIALPHVERRIEALAEVHRVLRPKGMALLHLDVRKAKMPELLDRDVPRLLILDGEREIPFRAICDHWRALGFDIELKFQSKKRKQGKRHVLLKMKKKADGPLPACATLAPELSRALRDARPPSEGLDTVWWGHLCAYRLTAPLERPTAEK